MNIGIDIDGVIIDDDEYRLATMAKFCVNQNLPQAEKPYTYEEKCNWSFASAEAYHKEYFYEYIKNAPARMYAAEVIEKLHHDGHKIIIITGRYKTTESSEIGDKIRKDTVDWLLKNGIYYDKVVFANCPKLDEIAENHIDVMIDDSPWILREVTKITKVLCFDNRYNRGLEYDSMIRVFSWYDIYSKISLI